MPFADQEFSVLAHSDGSGWEGICVDLDIAVQAPTLNDVVDLLQTAVASYVEDALHEEERAAARLLSRRAPLAVRAGYFLRTLLHLLFGRDGSRTEASFDVRCPA